MSRTIFYSWQSDLPNSHNRGFIADVLKEVLKKINTSQEYDIDLNLDRDTNGESGSPDIVNTIFQKIKNSEIFVCDISLVNTHQDVSRRTPNPNVLVELGYAAATLGWDNVICLFNTFYGELNQLPFDIQHRRILTYNLGNTDALLSKKEVRMKLVNTLIGSLDSSGVEYLMRKREIIKVYQDEPEEAVKIAIHKPEFWEFKLAENLFIYKLKKLSLRLESIDSGVYFKKKQHLNNDELFIWHQTKLDDLMSLFNSMMTIYQNHYNKSFGKPGEPGDEIQMLQSINLLFDRINDCLDWEIEVASILPPEKIQSAFKEISKSMREMVMEFYKAPKDLKDVYTLPEPEGGHNLVLVFKISEKAEKAHHEIIDYLRNSLLPNKRQTYR